MLTDPGRRHRAELTKSSQEAPLGPSEAETLAIEALEEIEALVAGKVLPAATRGQLSQEPEKP